MAGQNGTGPRVQSKPPGNRVPSDSYQVEVGGVTYYPHVGEWVEYRSAPTISDQLTMIRFAGFGELAQQYAQREAAGEDVGGAVEAMIGDLLNELASGIRAWNWTDDNGIPYASPPTGGDLAGLSMPELTYLLSRGAATGETEGEQGKDSAVSTTTSTAVRVLRPRKSG